MNFKSVVISVSLILLAPFVNANQSAGETSRQVVVSSKQNTPEELLKKYDASDVNNALANALYYLQNKRFGHDVKYSEPEMIQDIGVLAHDSALDVNFKSSRKYASSNFAYLMWNKLFDLVDLFLTPETDFSIDGDNILLSALVNPQVPGLTDKILNHPNFNPHQKTDSPFHTVIINTIIEGIAIISGRSANIILPPLLNHPKTDVNLVSNDDRPKTPLMVAIVSVLNTDRGDLRKQAMGAFKLILTHPKLNPKAKLPEGDTILTYAAKVVDFDRYRDDVEVFESLLSIPEFRAQLNQKDADGNTPLRIIRTTVSSYKKYLSDYLVQQGAIE